MSTVLESPAEPDLGRRQALLRVAGICVGISAAASFIVIQIKRNLSTIVNAGANAVSGGGADNSSLNIETMGLSGDFHQMPGWRVTVAAIPERRFDPSSAITIRLDNIDRKRTNSEIPVVGLGQMTTDLDMGYRDVDNRVNSEIVKLIRKLVVSSGVKEHPSIEEIYRFIKGERGNNLANRNTIILGALQNWLFGYDRIMGGTGDISNGKKELLTQTSLDIEE